MNKQIAIHKTFEKGQDGVRQAVIYTSDGNSVDRLTQDKFARFLEKLPPTTIVRATAVNATDAMLLDLAERGNPIFYAFWHDTHLSSGLEPEALVMAYAQLRDEIFRQFKPRRDIADLKRVLAYRNAIVQFAGDATRRLKQASRDVNDPELELAESDISDLKKQMVLEPGTSLDKTIEKKAKVIPECRLFKQISGIEGSWIMAASFVAYSGGFDRFPTVASLWHYYGQHVVDGAAPKRKKGQNIDWNPRGRVMLYQLASTIIKNRKNPWRAVFDEYRAQEIAMHDTKHPGCKHKDGHSTSRAMRKMVKEIVKQFFLAYNGVQFQEGHNPLANSGEKTTQHLLVAA